MFHRKYRTIFFAIVLGLFLSQIPVSTDSVNLSFLSTNNSQLSSEVWSDDFENETLTLNQWIFEGYNTTHGGECPPNVTVSNGMLYSTGPIINSMYHNSTTTTGTWSLDVFLDYDFGFILIAFMSYSWFHVIGGPNGYLVYLWREANIIHFTLAYWDWDPAGSLIEDIDTYSFNRTSGWVHIDITRQADSNLYTYLNGTLRLQGMDTHVSTSEYFVLKTYMDTNSIFDNVTVSDTVDIIDHVSPYWIEPLVDQSITEGDDFLYSLHADDYAGLDTWWVTDSTHFAIDQEGTLTSVSTLAVGNYNVEVFVNDTFGNVLSGNFNLEVSEVITTTTTTGTPETLDPLTYVLLAISVGSGVVIIVVVLRIYWLKKTRL